MRSSSITPFLSMQFVEQFAELNIFGSPFFHQSIRVFHDFLIDIFPSIFAENFEAGFREFLNEDFVD